jgi:hypothetical protein|tara:strand:- start:19127 stop:21649 length:2523 start_codon:yes stop_codon:yes gene_type:complete
MPQDNLNIPDGYHFRDIQLELSLKPFFDNSPETREHVCREIYTQWQALCRHAETISIMLWVAEGSEILEYDGNPESEFEWARYHGAPNAHFWNLPETDKKGNPDHAGIGVNTYIYDPDRVGLHARAYLYRDEPAVFNYVWLRELVADLKRIGSEMTGKRILVGETFDIGPEFAKSRFKFDWHREILGDGPIFKEQFISCEAVLDGDDRCYAAYPKGIPAGTRIGTFLGKQLNCLFSDCGFDFLWLSNGFGFSLEPWAMVGEVFDGTAYHPERSQGIQERVLQFWKDLRADFHNDYHIRCRGTNLATGIDLGSDASPLKQIYEGDFAMDAPVNSPWAALDGDFGLELSGWMSHIAQYPGETFRYRFYTNDPWWKNSPWLDRYAREPHDIYLPLAVSRLKADGAVEIPRDLSILSVDDSDGMMPLSVPNEVTAHLLRARETAPDAPGPLLWVYPFDDFHECAIDAPERPLHADAFMCAAINEGFPLNTVVDAGEFNDAWAKQSHNGSILISAIPTPGTTTEANLLEALHAGADLMLYGNVPEGSTLLELLGLELAAPLEGDFELLDDNIDHCSNVGRTIRHTALLSAGGWGERVASETGSTACFYQLAQQGDSTRVAAATTTLGKGRLAWTRASLSTREYNPENPQPIRGPILKPLDSTQFYPAGRMLRTLLQSFDWFVDAELAGESQRMPYLTMHRHRNAYIFSGHQRNENSRHQFRHPLGAPLLVGRNNQIEQGCTIASGRTAWQNEVRVFLESGDDGSYRCEAPPQLMNGVHRRLLVHGCHQATLNFLVDPDYTETIRILREPHFPYFKGEFVDPVIQSTRFGDIISVPKVNGSLLFEW